MDTDNQTIENKKTIYRIMRVVELILRNKKNIIAAAVILLLILGNLFFGVEYLLQLKENKKIQEELELRQTNDKVINFLSIFINKVLKTDKEVSFEDRLRLENSIRYINDSEVLSKWETFVNGENEIQIQSAVKNLLEVLVNKISH
jgi:hypothetical protein